MKYKTLPLIDRKPTKHAINKHCKTSEATQGTAKVIGTAQNTQTVQAVSFKEAIERLSLTKKSSIILALDFPNQNKTERENLQDRAANILEMVSPYICAVKINHHLTLPIGLFGGIQSLIKKAHEKGLLAIMDAKANDIGATNTVIAEYYFEAGFDAIIANPFVGWEEGLKPIFDTAAKHRKGVILLGYMSHKGANEGYGQTVCSQEGRRTKQYLLFAEKALTWKADGVVVGATVPEKIHEMHNVLGQKIPIYSPGVGAQGGAAEAALKAGARYLIVGREIVQASNPAEAAKNLQKMCKTAK
jgi:orotidine-5'-phosphate decarboxylase